MTNTHITSRVNSNYDAHTCIPIQHLAAEADLLLMKWPGYRFLSPVEATDLFIENYKEAYKMSFKRHIDKDAAEKMMPASKLKTSSNNAHYTQFWIARQCADTLCIPYELYLEFCFDFASRVTRRYLPQPNQLVFSDKSEEAWRAKLNEAWGQDELKTAFSRMAPMIEYCLENYRDLPAQNAFQKELLMMCKNSAAHFPTFFANRVISLRQLSAASCRSVFGTELVDAAVADAKSDIEDGRLSIHIYRDLETVSMMQACLGLPAIDRTASSVCQGCVQFELCTTVRKDVSQKLIATHGSEDPVGDQKRAKQRQYTAKSRAKAKMKGVSATAIPVSMPASS
jgi:hypothetical protein